MKNPTITILWISPTEPEHCLRLPCQSLMVQLQQRIEDGCVVNCFCTETTPVDTFDIDFRVELPHAGGIAVDILLFNRRRQKLFSRMVILGMVDNAPVYHELINALVVAIKALLVERYAAPVVA